MNKEKSKSFTLIELLIVGTIIVLLIAILGVFAFNFRNRSKDTRIVTNMDLLRKAAATYLIDYQNYSDFCASFDVQTLQTNIVALGGRNYTCQISLEGKSYCIEVQLNSGRWQCLDSGDRFQQFNTNPSCDTNQVIKSCQ